MRYVQTRGRGGGGLLHTLPLVQCVYTNVFSPPIVLPSEKISAGMYRSNGDGGREYSKHYPWSNVRTPMCTAILQFYPVQLLFIQLIVCVI